MKMQALLKFILWGLIVYVAYVGLVFLMARQIIFPRSHIGYPPVQPDNAQQVEKNWLETSSGKIETWFLPPRSGPSARPAPAVIFAHGNAELIDFSPGELKPFTEVGIGVLLVEYPGYGRSDGRPSQKSITEAFTAAYDMLVAREDVDPQKIILYGRSIGGGVVCALAATRPSAAMILVSTFTSIRSFSVRFLVPGFLVRDPFDNLKVVQNYSNPILIMHGRYDEIIPFRHSVALSKAAENQKFIPYDCGHNDCPPNWERFWQDIFLFLQAAGIIS
jgi:fermentation-respiration switch protein FrsA (DUF1100 family)